jgi:hypothetical protein
LIEATHALYRAALALESVQSSTGVPVGGRCSFLAENIPSEPGDGPGSMLATPMVFDDALVGIAEANDTLKEVVLPDLGPADVLTEHDLTIGTFGPGAASTHPARSDEFLQELAADLNAVVIHAAFEAGLSLHGALQRTTDPRAVEQIEEAIATLDELIRKTRSVFFDHGGPEG